MDGCAQNEPFALQVTDQSMEPEFPEGCIIISEPNGALEDGCYVVADTTDGTIFRQLIINGSTWRLCALQQDIADITISGPADIRGRVVQRAGRTRKDRKFYL